MFNRQNNYSEVSQRFRRERFLRGIEAKLELVTNGRVTITCQLQEHLSQQPAVFHNGVVSTLGSTAATYAALTILNPGEDVVLIDYKISFIQVALTPKLIATGKVISASQAIIVTETLITDEENEKIIAKLLGTIIVIN